MRRVFGDQRGIAAVELGILLPFFLLLVGGALDIGYLLSQQAQVDQAAYSAGSYALQNNVNASNISSVQTAGANGTSLNVTVAATYYGSACLNTTTGALMTSGCSGSVTLGNYVKIVVSYSPSSPPFPLASLILPTTLTNTTIVRVS